MNKALIIGGTSGLGYELAKVADARGLCPAVLGRTASSLIGDPNLPHATLYDLDLNDLEVDYPEPVIKTASKFVFWVAGSFLRKSFSEVRPAEHQQLWNVHIHGPLRLLRAFIRCRGTAIEPQPFTLVVVASNSSWRLRDSETEYCMVKAAKAAFARQMGRELNQGFPGSRVLLVNPGGMRTSKFWSGTDVDISSFMNPVKVSNFIWEQLDRQHTVFCEMNILRAKDGSPDITWGPAVPETELGLVPV